MAKAVTFAEFHTPPQERSPPKPEWKEMKAKVAAVEARKELLATGWGKGSKFRFSGGKTSMDSGKKRRKNKPVCRFYANGHCNRGDKCRFRHPKSEDSDGDEKQEVVFTIMDAHGKKRRA